MSFIENRGRVDGRVAYYADAGAASLFFTRDGLTLALSRGHASKRNWALQQVFLGGQPTASPQASGPAPGVFNSFVGPRSRWHMGIRSYESVTYRHVWKGVDVVYSGRARGLETSIVIHPGADPGAIDLAYRGATAVRVNRAGGLEIFTPAGVLSQHRPIAYQSVRGRRVPVRVRFELLGGRRGREGADGYGFRLGRYDASRPVVVDPVMFGYAGFLGGSGDDHAFGVAVDSAGDAYVAGSTDSPDFPSTPGPFSAPRGSRDAFVAKLDPTGRLVYADFIGGAGYQDVARGVAVDQYGDAYIAGPTDSPQSSFPVTVGPDLTYNGNEDVFVAKLDPTGTKLVYAGYIGGDGGEGGRDIAVDANGYAYVAGTTSTTDSTFPAKVGPQLHYGGGNHDGFVAKVKQDGSGLVYCSYIGGEGDEDNVRGVAPDAAGNLYITGHVGWGANKPDTSAGFPVTVGPDLTYHGGMDGYVGKIDPTGTKFDYLGYIGGSGFEQPRRIAVDAAGDAYIAGATQSPDYPVKVGPDLTFHGGTSDVFITKVNPSGTGLVYSGFIGGTGRDEGYALTVDPTGSAYVVGSTIENKATFPVKDGPDLTYNGGQDAFIAKVNPTGTGLDYAGYIGGAGDELAEGVGVDSAGRAVVVGTTTPSEGFPTQGPLDSSYNGGPEDVFLARVDSTPALSWTRANVDGSTALEDVSCPSSLLCVAVDAGGNVLTSRDPAAGGSAWSKPVNVDGTKDLVAVSCASSALCAAVDATGHVLTSNDPTGGESAWSTPVLIDDVGHPRDISCAAGPLCVVVDDSGHVLRSTNAAGGASAWSPPIPLPAGALNKVSCPTRTFCTTIDQSRVLFTSTDGGTSWSTGVALPGVNSPQGLSCTPSPLCAIVDEGGDVIASTDPTGDASTWSTTHLDGFGAGGGVSCSGSACVGVDQTVNGLGDAASSSNPTGGPSTWTVSGIAPGKLFGVSCASSSLCVAVDNVGDVVTSFQRQLQTITFAAPATGQVGGSDPLSATATASSGLPVALSVDPSTTNNACALSGSTVSYQHPGNCVIDANQAGDHTYAPVLEVQRTTVVEKISQTITVTGPSTGSIGGSGVLRGSATSGLPVTLSVDSSTLNDGCTLSGNTVSYQHAGDCVIDADQAGDANYAAAPQAQWIIRIGKASQTIGLTAPSIGTVGGSDALDTSASSGLPVTLSVDPSTSNSACVLNGNTVSYQHAGDCVIDADQPGNGIYDSAAQVQWTITVRNADTAKASQTIRFMAPSIGTVGGSKVLSASASSGLAVTLSVDPFTSNDACTLSGPTVRFQHAGNCVIDATQPGDATYAAAPQIQRTIRVSVANLPPAKLAPPATSGTPKAGRGLACSTGAWGNAPTSFGYQWVRNGTALVGETRNAYRVGALDQGTALVCRVTATNAAGSSSAASRAVKVPIPFVAHCPRATGTISGQTVGLVHLGMTRARARLAYRHHSYRREQYEDFFCLTPIGVRVGYASPQLLAGVASAPAARVRGRVVWSLTSNPYYALDGVRPGESIADAVATLHVTSIVHVGLDDWYLGRRAGLTVVLGVRRGEVRQVGIASNSLTGTRRLRSILAHSFQ